MNAWFRLWAEYEDDPKVQIMPEEMQRRLVMLFCERCKGEHRTEQQRAFKMHITPAQLQETKTCFIEAGIIDEDWNLVNWNKRQFLSDSSTDRVRRHRINKGVKQDETLHETNHETDVTEVKRPQIQTQTQTQKQITETEKGLSPSSAAPTIRPQEFANVWNRERGTLPRVQEFTDERYRKVKARMRSGLTLERFREAVVCCRGKPFLRGDNDRGWVATFDWLIANGTNVQKAIEQPYGADDGRQDQKRAEGNAGAQVSEDGPDLYAALYGQVEQGKPQ